MKIKYGIGLIMSMICGVVRAVELNNVIGVQTNGNAIVISCDQVGGISPRVKLEAWDDDIIRVWFSPNGLFDYYNSYNSYMIQPGLNKFTGPKRLEMTEQDSFFLVKTSKIAVKVNKSPFGISFYTADMSTLLLKQNAARAQTDSISFERDARGIVEHYYGMPGSGGTNIDMRNESIRFDESNDFGWVAPFFMSSVGYGIYMHNEYLMKKALHISDSPIMAARFRWTSISLRRRAGQYPRGCRRRAVKTLNNIP